MHRVDPARVQDHLWELAVEIGARAPGTEANRRACDYVREVLRRAGLVVREDPFTTRYWEPGAAQLSVDGLPIPATPGPYSRTTAASGAVVRLNDPRSVRDVPAGQLLVLEPGVVPDMVMPKSFPFYQPPEHAALVQALELLDPAGVIVLTDGQPPFEDADLCFPTATVPVGAGDQLRDGRVASLTITGAVHEGTGVNVSARTPARGRRVVVSAHVDSKATTPGAFDNAAGVAAVLAWVESGLPDLPLEVVLFNGEDHFDAPGEQAWLAATALDEVKANVNLDGVGVVGRDTSLSFLAAPPALEQQLTLFALSRDGWQLEPPWFESDHAVFAMRGIPALALTSVGVHDLLTDVAHTVKDTVDGVDPQTLADVADGLNDLVVLLDEERIG